MNFFTAENYNECAKILAERIDVSLKNGEKVAWLIPGGSNIPISVTAMHILKTKNTDELLANLSIALTDERYGAVGHKDSNWQQLIDAGFLSDGVHVLPVLENLSLEQTLIDYSSGIKEFLQRADKIIGQFGIGADGHIAGVLPHTLGVTDPSIAVAYEISPYIRITLTLETLKRISIAYAFVFGEQKKGAIMRLQQEEQLSLNETPAAILKLLPEAYLYTDQLASV